MALVLLITLFAFGQYVSVKNTLVSKNESVKAAWSQVDIVLQRRSDLIPNLVETVKGYAQQEVTVACRIEAGARMGMQQPWTHAIARQGVGEGFHHGAIEWDIAQDQRMRKMGKAT